jgi:tRNA 2-thiouridine synthesizing protein B
MSKPKMLHIVNKSPFEKNSLATCMRLSAQGSSILLIEDGVYGALGGTDIEMDVKSNMDSKRIFVLGPDLKARGINHDKLVAGVEVVDYEGFVKLAAGASKSQSWL